MRELTYEDVVERVIFDLESWCNGYHPSMYVDPSKSIRQIAERAKFGFSNVKKSGRMGCQPTKVDTGYVPKEAKAGYTLKEISDWVHKESLADARWANYVNHHDAVAIACAALHDLGYRHPTPISLTDRLPGPEDCDEEGRCWFNGLGVRGWVLQKAVKDSVCYRTVWLPHHALPLPLPDFD